MSTEFRGTPGIYQGPGLKSRNIFTHKGPSNVSLVPTFAFLDGTYSRDTGASTTTSLRAGLAVGKITSSGKYRPSIIGVTTAAYTSGGTSLTVPAAVATEVARLIVLNGGSAITLTTIGPPAAAGTVAATSTTCSAASGTTLTVTSLGVNKAAGSIICPADGSQAMLTVLPGPYPIDVVDTSGVAVDQPIHEYLRGADLLAAAIINLSADDNANAVDTSVTAYVKAALKSVGVFTFDSDR